jgi:hypothetical protein
MPSKGGLPCSITLALSDDLPAQNIYANRLNTTVIPPLQNVNANVFGFCRATQSHTLRRGSFLRYKSDKARSVKNQKLVTWAPGFQYDALWTRRISHSITDDSSRQSRVRYRFHGISCADTCIGAKRAHRHQSAKSFEIEDDLEFCPALTMEEVLTYILHWLERLN